MLNRIVPAAGALLALALVLPPPTGAATLEREFRYERSRVQLTPESGRMRVDFVGGSPEDRPGMPDLPRVAERVDLPDGMRIVSIEVTALETEPLADAVRVPSAWVIRPGLEPEQRTPEDPVAFAQPGFQPGEAVRLGLQGLERGHGVALLAVTPVRWDAAGARLERIARLRVRLTLEPATWSDAAPRERIVPEWEDSFRLGAAGSARAAAPAGLSGARREAQPFAATQIPSLLGSPVEYLIITSDEMSGEFQRLADWKTREGVPAVVRTMSFVRQQYPQGSDDAERVRLFIRDAYTRWGIKYVLLGGDTEVLPTRLATTTFYGGEHIACDMYYSCLDGNWNADGDSAYGEGYGGPSNPGDNVDLFPDVYVGRAPATTVAQAKLFVDKSLQYVTDPDTTNGYQHKSLAFAEVLFPQNWSPGMTTTLDGAELIEEILPYFALNPCQSVTRLYENYLDPRWLPGALQERRLTVIDSLDAGYNLAIHVGHGYRNVMSVGDDNLTNNDAMSLSNGRRLTNLYAIDCTSNAIDFPCIGEAFLQAPNGGAVTNIGSTRFDFPTAGRGFQSEYFRLMFQDSMNAVGELQARQKVPFVSYATYDGVYRWTEMTLLLLGDPELRIYTCPPRTLAVSHPVAMLVSDTTFSVHVETGGLPLYGARVTLYKPGFDYATALTDGAGNVTLPFRPDTLGSMQLTVTAYNAKPFQEDVTVAPSLESALAAAAPALDDDGTGGTVGNGDGFPDAGETIDVQVGLRNNGVLLASGVVGTLSTADAMVTVTQPTVVYGTIAANATVSPVPGFRIHVSSAASDQREVPFALDLIDVNGRHDVQHFQLTVRAPELRHVANVIVDTGGNNDGRPDPGETISYSVRLRNMGTGVAPGATAVLRSLDGLATITDSTCAWGAIAPGEEKTGDPLVFVPASTAALLQLRVSDAYGLLFAQTLDLLAPPAPVSLIAKGMATDVSLTWGHVALPDLQGYNVYRSAAPGGPFARANAVPTDRTSYYLDSGLTPLTNYYYRVTAVDSSGNESDPSVVGQAATSPPNHAIFPIPMGRNTPSSVAIEHVYSGYPVVMATGADVLFVWYPDGTTPVDADGQGTTVGDFTRLGLYYPGGPSIGDIDGDGIPEFVSTTWDSISSIYAFDRNGASKPGFPIRISDSFTGTALGDIDGDGKNELVFASNGGYFYVLRGNGTDVIDGDGNPATKGVFKLLGQHYDYSTPALADLDGDGKVDIIFGGADGLLNAWRWNGTNLPGFPVSLGAGISASPAIGYLDGPGDSQLEIVVGGGNDSLYVIEQNGTRRPGFPQRVMTTGVSKTPSPALADMNNDGYLDIVQASTDGRVFVFDRSGAVLPPFTGGVRYSSLTQYACESSPVVADINGDGWNDVVIGSEDATLTAISGATGTILPGFPIALGGEVRGTPAVCDCDGDGKTEIVVSDWDTHLYMWDYDFPFSPGKAPPWPQFHHDARRTGFANSPLFVGVDDGSQPPSGTVAELSFARPQPNPARTATRLWYAIPSSAAGAPLDFSIYDLGGRRVCTLVKGLAQAGRFSAGWDLRGDDGARVRDGVYFARLVVGEHALAQKVIVLD